MGACAIKHQHAIFYDGQGGINLIGGATIHAIYTDDRHSNSFVISLPLPLYSFNLPLFVRKILIFPEFDEFSGCYLEKSDLLELKTVLRSVQVLTLQIRSL